MPTSAEIQIAAHKGRRRAEALAQLNALAGSPAYPQAGNAELQIAAHPLRRKAEVIALLRIASGGAVPDAGDYALVPHPGQWWAALLENLSDASGEVVPSYGNAELQIAAHEGLWWAEILAALNDTAGGLALPQATVADFEIAMVRADFMAYILAGSAAIGAIDPPPTGLTADNTYVTVDRDNITVDADTLSITADSTGFKVDGVLLTSDTI